MMAGFADKQNAVQQGQQPDIEPHIAIEDMAEFVGNHALQFVTA